MGLVPQASSDSSIPARVAANRSVLIQVQISSSEQPDGLISSSVFSSQAGADETVGLVPRIDAGLDSGHRFAMLGAIFRPMRQFLRRTFDGDEESEISSDRSD